MKKSPEGLDIVAIFANVAYGTYAKNDGLGPDDEVNPSTVDRIARNAVKAGFSEGVADRIRNELPKLLGDLGVRRAAFESARDVIARNRPPQQRLIK